MFAFACFLRQPCLSLSLRTTTFAEGLAERGLIDKDLDTSKPCRRWCEVGGRSCGEVTLDALESRQRWYDVGVSVVNEGTPQMTEG